jgi:hypothetical protein
MKITTRTLLAALVLTTVAVGCTDRSESPTDPTTVASAAPLYSESSGECTETMVICDDGSEPPRWVDDGFEEVYNDVTDGDMSFEESTSDGSYDASYSSSRCPSYVVGVAQGTVYVTNPSGRKVSVTFRSRGTWSWKFDTGPSTARYNWPPGYWQAIDGSGIEVQVGSVDGTCLVGPAQMTYVSLGPNYYFVNARFPRRRGYHFTGGGGGGGDGSGGTQCREEQVTVEVNYGDGTGWHVVYRGTATVCE